MNQNAPTNLNDVYIAVFTSLIERSRLTADAQGAVERAVQYLNGYQKVSVNTPLVVNNNPAPLTPEQKMRELEARMAAQMNASQGALH